MKTNYRKIYYTSLSIAGIILLMWLITKFVSSIAQTSAPTHTTSTEYLDIFKPETREKLTTVITYNSKVRSPFSVLDYDSKKYCIVITKLSTSKEMSLKNIYALNEFSDNNYSGEVYDIINLTFFDLKYLNQKNESISKINLNYSGDCKTIVSNDSVALFRLAFNNFSLSYNSDKQYDMYISKDSKEAKEPLNLLFIKKSDSVYIIMMTVNNPGDILPPISYDQL